MTDPTDATPFAHAAEQVQAGADHHVEAWALVDAMTIEEQLGCLDGDIEFWEGIVDMVSGGYHGYPWPAAVVERLGIPGIHFADGPRGCVIGPATCFPVSMARGATFDPELEERIGQAIGFEVVRELEREDARLVRVVVGRHPGGFVDGGRSAGRARPQKPCA